MIKIRDYELHYLQGISRVSAGLVCKHREIVGRLESYSFLTHLVDRIQL